LVNVLNVVLNEMFFLIKMGILKVYDLTDKEREKVMEKKELPVIKERL